MNKAFRRKVLKRVILGGLMTAGLLVAATAVLSRDAVIRVENQSSTEIHSLRISGDGFEKQITRLRVGGARCVRTSGIRSESGLAFTAIAADGRVVEATDLWYLERGYHVRVDLLPNLKVRASQGSIWLALCGLGS